MSQGLHVWHPVCSISQKLTVPHTRPTLLCQRVLRREHLQGTPTTIGPAPADSDSVVLCPCLCETQQTKQQ